ncbi:hypothetical protein IMZ48_27535 [Candidatus Bathyarchaeota archaeon]|nr:hypothetical protein [Candidatus Bathyarchaeota archaeon]
MLLDPKIPQHQEVPREYNLPDNDTFDKDGSQYVFAEEDLKGFKDKSRNTGLPLSILRARSERVDKPKWDRNRNRNQVYYRKAIPSKPCPPAPRSDRVLTEVVNREDKGRRPGRPRDDGYAHRSGAG